MAPGAPCGRTYLIDSHSLIFQVFHAIPEMSSPSGLPTNALFGFTKDVLNLRGLNPDYLICAFDLSGPTFRDRIYPEYKANRAPMPDDLQTQIPLIRQMLEAMRIPVATQEGYEADDVIATIATSASQRGLDVLVCTSDKDCRQLIDDHVTLYNLRKNKVLDRSALQEDWAITPEQVVDLQALVGDSVDNVPGVPGIGLKTAAKLLQEYGTLDNVLANAERDNPTGVLGRRAILENLRAFKDKVQVSRQLVRLDRNVPIEMDWEAWKPREWDAPKLLALFQEWGFHRFADQVRASRRETVRPAASREPKLRQGSLFPAEVDAGAKARSPQAARPQGGRAATAATSEDNGQREAALFAVEALEADVPAAVETAGPWRDNWKAVYHLVDTPAKFSEFIAELAKQPRFAIDLETTSLSPRQAAIVGYAISWQAGEAYYLAVRAPEEEARLDPETTLDALRGILENEAVEKINQNVKYDRLVLRQAGVNVAGVRGDPMLADYLLHAGERSHNLEDLANRYLDHTVIPITNLIGKGKKQLCMDQVPALRVAEYAGEDADVAWRLCELLEPKLREEKLADLYRNLEIPLVEVLAELEFNGVRLDVAALERLGHEMAGQLAAIEIDIYRLAGREFNIASPKQLREVLFDEMKLPAQRRTGVTGESSTDQETLERLAALGHELPVKIVEHRQIAKLKGTYVDALPTMVVPTTGRVHASFNQTVAATGRLSSSDPNLQNVPVRTAQGRQIRQAFVPEPGWVLLTADYSQIELRLLAHFSGDENMRQAFAEDRDVHAAVAAQIYGVPEANVDAAMRRTAKTVNFGVIYGISAVGLATRLGISRPDAARFIDAYFARYPRVAEYQTRLLDNCYRTQYVGTIMGRRRQITGVRARSKYQQRNQPEREAINMEIQGSAADLIKVAMLNVYRRLRSEHRKARMLLQIHDELVFEVPPEELGDVARLVNEEMTQALPLTVPVKVDVAAGANWLDVEDVRV